MKSESLPWNIPLNRPSLRRLLQDYVFAALKDLAVSLTLTPEAIPLYRYQQSHQIVYRCAIAFQLANHSSSSATAIARQLRQQLLGLSFSLAEQPLIEFTLEVADKGWLDFSLGDRALALWLQHLPHLLPADSFAEKSQLLSSQVLNPFLSQYAHARCCSLLRLGHRERLIQLLDPTFSQPIWQWQSPNPIPWCHKDLDNHCLQLVHSAESRLINQLLEVTEQLESSRTSHSLKLATALSQAMLNCDRYCRIFGAIAQENPTLAQARLGLIALSQRLLQALLLSQLGIESLTDL